MRKINFSCSLPGSSLKSDELTPRQDNMIEIRPVLLEEVEQSL